MVSIADGFGGHEFMLEINHGNFGHFGGVIQSLKTVDERQRFPASRQIGNSFQFFDDD